MATIQDTLPTEGAGVSTGTKCGDNRARIGGDTVPTPKSRLTKRHATHGRGPDGTIDYGNHAHGVDTPASRIAGTSCNPGNPEIHQHRRERSPGKEEEEEWNTVLLHPWYVCPHGGNMPQSRSGAQQ